MLYRIADLTVQMECLPEGRTASQARAYRASDDVRPDIVLPPSLQILEENAEKYPAFSAEEREYMLTGTLFYQRLLQFDGLVLHASAIAVDGKGYVFSAPCGTGKSTHAALWQERFGARTVLLNDDKPALRRTDDTWRVYGTPWSGKTDKNLPLSAPLCGICLLKQDTHNRIRRVTAKEALNEIFTQTLRPATADEMHALLTLLDSLLTTVPLYMLGCTASPEAAELAYATMHEKGEKP